MKAMSRPTASLFIYFDINPNINPTKIQRKKLHTAEPRSADVIK